ncbi:helix-turn-helix domain-containing protein [Clostridium polynesiense]|uniref:helix-turn-helix domain-containing protein n=1 Tax=Clostridium polynesiense TaxID=1325933 RepID=UPI00058FD6BF|nr:helix-turn-helix domain-containing protein [Clostridium polynesiense]
MKYYKVDGLAELFNVHADTIKREVQRNNLKCFRVGKEIRFTQESIDDYTNVVNNGKTTREVELENKIEELQNQICDMKAALNRIKNEIIKF